MDLPRNKFQPDGFLLGSLDIASQMAHDSKRGVCTITEDGSKPLRMVADRPQYESTLYV